MMGLREQPCGAFPIRHVTKGKLIKAWNETAAEDFFFCHSARQLPVLGQGLAAERLLRILCMGSSFQLVRFSFCSFPPHLFFTKSSVLLDLSQLIFPSKDWLGLGNAHVALAGLVTWQMSQFSGITREQVRSGTVLSFYLLAPPHKTLKLNLLASLCQVFPEPLSWWFYDHHWWFYMLHTIYDEGSE